MAVVAKNSYGISLMVLGAGVLLLNDALAKFLIERYHVWQVVLLRQVAAILPILVYVQWSRGWVLLKAHNWVGQTLRGLCFTAAVWFMVTSLSLLPLATVTAIAFASPVFVAVFSAPILREHVGWRQWAAISVGFAGVLIIVRPVSTAFDWALAVPVGAAMAAGLRDVLTRRLARRDLSLTTLFWSSVIVVTISLPIVVGVGWHSVTTTDWALFLLSGLLNAGAHLLMIEAFRNGQAAVVSPFRYTALVWSVLIGFLVWGDVPDRWTIVGALVIAGSGVYLLWRGSRPSGAAFVLPAEEAGADVLHEADHAPADHAPADHAPVDHSRSGR